MLPNNHKAPRISELQANLDHWVGRLTPGSYSSDEMLYVLVGKIPRDVWEEWWATAEHKARTLTYEDLSVLLLELALEKESDQHLNAYRTGGGNSGKHGPGHQGLWPGQGTTPKNARYMGNVQASSGLKPETSRLSSCMPQTAISMSASWSRATSRRPTLVGRLRCLTTTGVPSPAPSVASASAKRMSATTSNACRPSGRVRPRVAVEVPEARAKAGKARGSLKAEAKDKVKHKAKVEDTEARRRRTMTRTMTRTRKGPGETPSLRHGGPILSPLVGSLWWAYNPSPDASPARTRDSACQRGWGPV